MRNRFGLVLTAALLVAGSVISAAGPASAAPTWSVVPGGNGAGRASSFFASVACPTATGCFAVGSNANGSGRVALIERWNGSQWSIMAGPHPTGTSELTGLACPTATNCFAVGDVQIGASIRTFVEHWNGTAWSVVASPNVAGTSTNSGLLGVTCTSTAMCFAVGYSSIGLQYQSLVEQWNGTAWVIVASPNPAGESQVLLEGVACASGTSCIAVGTASGGPAVGPLVENWDGSAWSLGTAPSPPGGTFPQFFGVSCTSATACSAAGVSQSSGVIAPFVERWDGLTWSIQVSANPPGVSDGAFHAISCSTASSCVAVGSTDNEDLIESWDGTAWTQQRSFETAPLQGVTCTTPVRCFAVGGSTGATVGAIERWDGTAWHSLFPPSVFTPNGALAGVACATATTCFGVGHFENNARFDGVLIARSNGASWVAVPTANPSNASRAELQGIDCPTATLCFAVGSYQQGSTTHNLLLRWTGSAWSGMAIPQPAAGSLLSGVSCVSATNCFAVGTISGGVTKTLVLRWNGNSWQQLPSPNKSSTGANWFNGVSCASASSCFAVGAWQDETLSTAKTLIERWNGTAWTIVTSPNSAAGNWNQLAGVSCPTATSCYAVGNVENFSQTFSKTLVEHWNGTAWSLVASANVASSFSFLSGVSCPSATSCFAVGNSYVTDRSNRKTLVEQFTGVSTAIKPSPNPAGVSNNFLLGVDCTTISNCFAVGISGAGTLTSSLVEKYA